MFDPRKKVMRPVPTDISQLTDEQHKWVRFEEGEIFYLKGILMRVHEINENRLVLKFK